MMSYFKEIAVGFWSLLAGMAVTIRYFVKPIVTVQYPRAKDPDVPEVSGLSPVYHRSRDPDAQVHRLRNVRPHLPVPTDHRGGHQVSRVKSRSEPPSTSMSISIAVFAACASKSAPPRPWSSPRFTAWRAISREDCVIDHLTLLQTHQKAAGVPVTPIPTAADIDAALAAEAAAKAAKEKEAKAKAEAQSGHRQSGTKRSKNELL